MDSEPLVFLNYAIEDEGKVRKLCRRLSRIGFRPWMPTLEVLPGEEEQRIAIATIKNCAFFLVCLTKAWSKNGGIHQAHFNKALEKWYEHSERDIFLIPVLLEKESPVPEKLVLVKPVNYFENDGWIKLSHALNTAMTRRRREQRNTLQKKKEQPKIHLRLLGSSHWPPRELVHAIVNKDKSAVRCSVIVGNGLSETAGYFSWSEIITQMAELLKSGKSRKYITEMRNLARNNPLGFLSLVKTQKKQSYYRLLAKIFGQEGKKLFSNLHKYLLETEFHLYLTTNFDCCLDNAARELARSSGGGWSGIFYHPDFINLKAIEGRQGAICHLHGSLYRYDGTAPLWIRTQRFPDQIVLSAEDFFALYSYPSGASTNSCYGSLTLLDSVFQEETILFVGYSLNDPIWCKLLERFDGLSVMSGSTQRNRHYALMPLTSETDLPRIQSDYLLKRYGIKVEFFPSSVDGKGRIDFSGLEDYLKSLKEKTL